MHLIPRRNPDVSPIHLMISTLLIAVMFPVFGFGLVHGFGFASVLADLGLPSDALALSLVGLGGIGTDPEDPVVQVGDTDVTQAIRPRIRART